MRFLAKCRGQFTVDGGGVCEMLTSFEQRSPVTMTRSLSSGRVAHWLFAP